jgi:large subunit ribosomal protein L18
MESLKKKNLAHLKRKRRVRKKIWSDETRPRLSVFRSARNIYAQIIVDTTGQTLVQVSSLSPEIREVKVPGGKVAVAQKVGGLLAQKALEKGIKKVVFDRNGFLYHGRVKAVSLAAREAGLEF